MTAGDLDSSLLGRIVRPADYVRVLATPMRLRSPHFAVHHLVGRPLPLKRPMARVRGRRRRRRASAVERRLATVMHRLPPACLQSYPQASPPTAATGVDDLQVSGLPALVETPIAGRRLDRWLGLVVPKRHAKRAVTRTLVKRQIRNVAAACAPAARARPVGGAPALAVRPEAVSERRLRRLEGSGAGRAARAVRPRRARRARSRQAASAGRGAVRAASRARARRPSRRRHAARRGHRHARPERRCCACRAAVLIGAGARLPAAAEPLGGPELPLRADVLRLRDPGAGEARRRGRHRPGRLAHPALQPVVSRRLRRSPRQYALGPHEGVPICDPQPACSPACCTVIPAPCRPPRRRRRPRPTKQTSRTPPMTEFRRTLLLVVLMMSLLMLFDKWRVYHGETLAAGAAPGRHRPSSRRRRRPRRSSTTPPLVAAATPASGAASARPSTCRSRTSRSRPTSSRPS